MSYQPLSHYLVVLNLSWVAVCFPIYYSVQVLPFACCGVPIHFPLVHMSTSDDLERFVRVEDAWLPGAPSLLGF